MVCNLVYLSGLLLFKFFLGPWFEKLVGSGVLVWGFPPLFGLLVCLFLFGVPVCFLGCWFVLFCLLCPSFFWVFGLSCFVWRGSAVPGRWVLFFLGAVVLFCVARFLGVVGFFFLGCVFCSLFFFWVVWASPSVIFGVGPSLVLFFGVVWSRFSVFGAFPVFFRFKDFSGSRFEPGAST